MVVWSHAAWLTILERFFLSSPLNFSGIRTKSGNFPSFHGFNQVVRSLVGTEDLLDC